MQPIDPARPKWEAPAPIDPWAQVAGLPVSLVGDSIPWAEAVREVCAQASLSVALPAGGDPIACDFRGSDVRDALRQLAEAREMSPVLDGRAVSFRPRLRDSVASFDPGWSDAEDALSVVEGAMGDTGRVKVVDGRFVVVGDSSAVDRAGRVSAALAVDRPRQWAVSVWLVETSDSFAMSLGARVSATGGIDLTAATTGNAAAVVGQLLVRTVLEAERSEADARLLTRATIVCTEGAPATLDAGSRVPIPKRTVSPQGTVTTQGYEYIDAGFSLRLLATKAPGGAARLSLKPTVANISGYRDEAPIVSRRTLDSVVVVHSGEWVVLAGLDDVSDSRQAVGLLGTAVRSEVSSRRVFIVLKVEVGE